MTKIQQSILQQSLSQGSKTFKLELRKCLFSFKKASFRQVLHKRKEKPLRRRFIFEWESNKLALLKNWSVIALRKFIEFQITNFEGQEDCLINL